MFVKKNNPKMPKSCKKRSKPQLTMLSFVNYLAFFVNSR